MGSDHVATAPFPYFGGKRNVAPEVWARFGAVRNYVEPFFGSGAVLLQRPSPFDGIETVNDIDGLLVNFWRATANAPDKVAQHADWPVSECDLSARHIELVEARKELTGRLEGDPSYFDPRLAGWWVWGACCWIGSGWCSGDGPWVRDGGFLTKKLPHLGDAGRGINDWFNRLASRMRAVRITCGSWDRVLGPSVTWRHGITAVFLDPPYEDGSVDYSAGGMGLGISRRVAEWAIENGERKDMRIALCGYEGEHEMPGWSVFEWKARGGFGNQDNDDANDNRHRERIWFSPSCLGARQGSLFDMGGSAK